jgi:hypothetical protein
MSLFDNNLLRLKLHAVILTAGAFRNLVNSSALPFSQVSDMHPLFDQKTLPRTILPND